MEIRKAKLSDLDCLEQLYEDARMYMHRAGNPDQWVGYPIREHILADIQSNVLYVTETNGKIQGAFAWIKGPDPCYSYIVGDWNSDEPYWVLHRVAGPGTGKAVFSWAKERAQEIRIDTHPQNKPMQKRLLAEGFRHCGAIRLKSGAWRQAWIWH